MVGSIFRREDLYLGVIVLGITCVLSVALARVNVPLIRPGSYLNNLSIYLLVWVIFLSARISFLLYQHRPPSPTRFLIASTEARADFIGVVAGLPVVTTIAFFMPGFSAVKSAIPLFTEYSWDPVLLDLDQTLHGTDPWRIMQPILGFPIVTAALAFSYHLWFMLIYAGTIYFAAYQKDPVLRFRYFLSFVLIWSLGGMLMAIGLASVGPAFLHPILGNDHFYDQMEYLRAANDVVPVLVVDVQDELLAWYLSGEHGLGRGISAMPSMHVALAFLFFLAMRRVSRAAGVVFGVFCAVVMLGSVHLGYHYALDGYVSVILSGAVWIVAGAIAKGLLANHAEVGTRLPGPSVTAV